MQPVVTVQQMQAVDARAVVDVGIETLIERAGYAAFRVAREMLGGLYGRHVVIVAGRGHNGDDGRSCGHFLRARGVKVTVLSVDEAKGGLPEADLVIDGAYGTGFHGTYQAPAVPAATPVLALDIPSGVDAMTGLVADDAVVATVTVTFGAYKPGLLLGHGPDHAGRIVVAPIGLDVGDASYWLVEPRDIEAMIPKRSRLSHKWQHALYLLAGSPGMLGAPRLCAYGALRAGTSMVRLGVPGAAANELSVTEAVAQLLPAVGFIDEVRRELDRCQVLVVGPGLGTDPKVAAEIRQLLSTTTLPMVIDADGLNALGEIPVGATPYFSTDQQVIVTPHDGEFARLVGRPPGDDRIGDVQELAGRLGAVVLLKGATTIVARPGGPVMLTNSGTSALASAGTGDVLAGVIGALVARGVDLGLAGALGAHLHGLAGAKGIEDGLIASDLPALVAEVLSGRDGSEDLWVREN